MYKTSMQAKKSEKHSLQGENQRIIPYQISVKICIWTPPKESMASEVSCLQSLRPNVTQTSARWCGRWFRGNLEILGLSAVICREHIIQDLSVQIQRQSHSLAFGPPPFVSRLKKTAFCVLWHEGHTHTHTDIEDDMWNTLNIFILGGVGLLLTGTLRMYLYRVLWKAAWSRATRVRWAGVKLPFSPFSPRPWHFANVCRLVGPALVCPLPEMVQWNLSWSIDVGAVWNLSIEKVIFIG